MCIFTFFSTFNKVFSVLFKVWSALPTIASNAGTYLSMTISKRDLHNSSRGIFVHNSAALQQWPLQKCILGCKMCKRPPKCMVFLNVHILCHFQSKLFSELNHFVLSYKHPKRHLWDILSKIFQTFLPIIVLLRPLRKNTRNMQVKMLPAIVSQHQLSSQVELRYYGKICIQ